MSFVLGNPVSFNDPSGNMRLDPGEDYPPPEEEEDEYWVKFDAEEGIADWTKEEKDIIQERCEDIGRRLSLARKKENMELVKMGDYIYTSDITPKQAFTNIFHNVTVKLSTYNPDQDAACEVRGDTILVHQRDWLFSNPRLIIHEFGHIFDNRIKSIASKNLPASLRRVNGEAGYGSDPYWNGFAGGKWDWQFTLNTMLNVPNECIADMFLGWVYNEWSVVSDKDHPLTEQRKSYMDTLMVNYY